MATFEREKLVSILTDARPALSGGGILPELSHFWFDEKYVYAYDGGLGVRLALETNLNCGVPGKVFYDLLKTSTLKEVFLDVVKETVVLQMGKAKVQVATLDKERGPWPFPASAPKKAVSLTLTEEILVALRQVMFVKTSDATQAVHHGVVFEPFDDHLELFTTDGNSMARVTVEEQLPEDVPRFVAPWGFLGRILELVEPDSKLFILDDCLLAGGGDVLICSNLLELPDAPNLIKTLGAHLTKDKPVALPAGFQAVLDRALILAGSEEPLLTLTIDGETLRIEGDYDVGSVNEKLSVPKSKMPTVSVRFVANLLVRGLGHAETFTLSKKSIVLYGGENFLYLLAAKGK